MTSKAEFNAEEWSTVVEGPPVAGMIVVTAEKGGTLRESIQLGKAYQDARQAQPGGELIEALLASPPELDPAGYKSTDEVRERGLLKLREAISILEGKAEPDEIDSYRGFVLAVAERVAHAHKTGGFLGFGGREVSDAEQSALIAISEAIGARTEPDLEG